MDESTELEDLRQKVRSLDDELYKIRTLAKRAIGDYDDLYSKNRDAKALNADLLRRYDEQEIKFQQVLQVLQGAANDFAVMESKMQLGEYLQKEAEKFASKMYDENRKIKRQSQKLMAALGESIVSFDIDIDNDPDFDTTSNESTNLESFTQTVEQQLKQKIELLESRLNNAEIERQSALTDVEKYKTLYQEEVLKLEETKHSLDMFESLKAKFARVTEIAQERIVALEEKVEKEQFLTEEAVQKAKSLHKKHLALKRQSLAVINSSRKDESLDKALEQIHKLTLDMESQRLEYENKLSQLSPENQTVMMNDLQKEMQALQNEYDELVKENKGLIHNLETANYDNRVLREKLDQAKKGPPPPPPPPPPPIKVVNPIKWIIGKKPSQRPADKGPKRPEGAENYDKALEELMQRIKSRSQEPSPGMQKLMEGDTNQTSKQLNDFIGVLKKTEFKPKTSKETESEPEFMKVRRKLSQPRNEVPEFVQAARDENDATGMNGTRENGPTQGCSSTTEDVPDEEEVVLRN